MYKRPASVSNLDWFWSSKRQNNCSHISRWTLTGLKQLSFTWFSINHVLVSNLIIRIFWGALLSLFLSGGMIFISHLLRRRYFFISQSALHYMFGSFTSHLTETYYCRYRVIFRSFNVSICCTVINISLICITSIRISSFKYQHLHQFCSVEVSE